MKKIFILLVLISSFAFAEVWDIHLTTNLNISDAQNIRLFSNRFGNNILVQTSSGALTYYVMNTQGVVVSSVLIESSGASLPCITGDNSKTYLVYSKSSVIKAKYTTDAGVSWIPTNYDLNVNPISLDAAYTDRLHITYCYNNHAIYYQYYIGSWTNSSTVSGTENGTNPRIQSLYHDNVHKIYVVYQNYNSCKSRELNITTNQWDILRTLYSNGITDSWPIGFGVDDNYLYNYYDKSVWDILLNRYKTYTVENTISKSDYSVISPYSNYNSLGYVTTTKTADNNIHMAYNLYHIVGGQEVQSSGTPDGLEHQSFSAGVANVFNIIPSVGERSDVIISSTYNDLFIIWKEYGSDYLSFAHFNAPPATPANLARSVYYTNDCSYPCLTWDFTSEPDVYANTSAYYIERRINSGAWSHISTLAGNANSFIDWDILYAGSGPRTAEYRIKAIDLNGDASSFTNSVSIRFGDAWKMKGQNNNNISEYKLYDNFPNPFNPSTEITYQLPNDGNVKLKVYNMMGQEVMTLVNGFKEKGMYSISFNAGSLASGMYIYKLEAGNYTQVKKMLLTK